MRRVAFTTLGCKVNQTETEAMKELFRQRGYKVVNFTENADVYIINTCTVTSTADRKSRQMARRGSRQNPKATVAMVGCLPQVAAAKVEKMPEVDVIIGTTERSRIVDLVERAQQTGCPILQVEPVQKRKDFEQLPLDYSARTRAFLKIQDGCNQYCSYCIIPHARGPVRSRPLKQLLVAAKELVARGYKEIVLTGIHLGLYGSDFVPPIDLTTPLRLLDTIPALKRIRISSLDPSQITDELLQLIAASNKICPHLHIPLQSGSSRILQRMNRPYSAREYLELITRIRKTIPRVGLTTDVMVGFPGESESDFADTEKIIREVAFSRLHVFSYSPRKGTPAAGFPDQVPGRIKLTRSRTLISLGQQLAKDFHLQQLGQRLQVLVEEEIEPGILTGYSDNYIRVRFCSQDQLLDQVVPVEVTAAEKDYVLGEPKQELIR
jgi:threonylcarbamoyladenosine tRNA methylthiotransferase MtaB